MLPRHRGADDRFLSGPGGVKLGHDSAPSHHQDAIAQAKNFRQLRGNEQNAKPLVCELAHDRVDFRLGADVDSARRLVKNEGVRPGAVEYEALLAEGDESYQRTVPIDELDAISLNYTSGTTGDPKGFVYHHRGANLLAVGNVVTGDMGRHPVYLWTLPMFHCNGWCFTWSISVEAGVHVCLRQVRVKAIYDLIAEHKVTHLCGAPIVMSVLLNAAERAWRSDRASRRPRIPGPVGRDRPGVSMPNHHDVERSREGRGIVDGCRKSQWERFRRAQTSRPPGVRRPGHFSVPTNVDPDQCAHAAICDGANGRLDGTSKTSRTWSFQLR